MFVVVEGLGSRSSRQCRVYLRVVLGMPSRVMSGALGGSLMRFPYSSTGRKPFTTCRVFWFSKLEGDVIGGIIGWLDAWLFVCLVGRLIDLLMIGLIY